MKQSSSQTSIDHKVIVTAQTIYLEEYSNPKKHKFLFCYKVRISNEGKKRVKLLNRHWIIIDSNSHKEEVKGPGVVGQHPELNPGEYHEYYSFCDLDTNFGSMEGSYEMIDEDDQIFSVEIPRFFLAETLSQFEKPYFKRGQIVKHKTDNYRALITDYDMYFMNDEELYNKNPAKPAKDKPWYYVLISDTNAISYAAQEQFELDENQGSIVHPLVDFFFNGFDGEKFIRNEKTWENLRSA